MVTISIEKKLRPGVRYVPSVIEPSFGIGRIMYAILEHSFSSRSNKEDEQRNYLSLPSHIAPQKVSIMPMGDEKMQRIIDQLVKGFVSNNLSSKVDTSGAALGRKYARADEIGVPYCVTIDFESLNDSCVTVRERDSMNQIRVTVPKAIEIISGLCNPVGLIWDDVYRTNPVFVRKADNDDNDGNEKKEDI